ncbi:hypothetical protein ACFIOY_34550 [Bradyrhizobium sp. TZ2]
MADEAFALSPISARAAMPSEDDYAAISEAFMETSRGRWFLTEYAKRNRNADTRMVLDAVARINKASPPRRKKTFRGSKTSAGRKPPPGREPSPEKPRRAAAGRGGRRSCNHCRKQTSRGARRHSRRGRGGPRSAAEALDSLALEQRRRRCARRTGAARDRLAVARNRQYGQICDLIDSQVAVIEKGAEQISSDEATATLSAAFAARGGWPISATMAPCPRPLLRPSGSGTLGSAGHAPGSGCGGSNGRVQQAAEARSGSLAAPAEAALAEAEAVLAEAAEAPPVAVFTSEAAEAQDVSLKTLTPMTKRSST